MKPKAFGIAFPRKSCLGVFFSIAISLSLLTPLAPAALGAGNAASPHAYVAPGAAPGLAFAPAISATKSDAFPDPDNDGRAAPGDTITYTVQIDNAGTDANGVVFNDTVDANTTFVPGSVTTTPLARDDSYAAVGNVGINVPAANGVSANDSDPDGDTLTASAAATSAQGGDVAMNPDGSFTYNPPAGFEGSDSFTYSVTDGDGPADTATVNVNVSGMVWFVNSSAAAGGDGRLTSPFNALTGAGSFDAVAADDQNDNIFLHSGGYTGGLALKSGQALIGQGSTASLETVAGLSPLPPYSQPLPATGGSNPVIGGASGISLATNNLLRGVTINNSAGTGISGSAFGTLAVADTAVDSAGQALDLDNGQLNASFQSISSTGSGSAGVSLTNVAANSVFSGGATTVNGAAGVGIVLGNVGSGSTLSFGATGVLARNATGIDLDAVQGSVAFGATNIPNPVDAGGYGIRVRNSSAAVAFGSATVSDSKTVVPQTDTAPADNFPDNDGDGDAIFLSNNTGSFAVGGGALSNCGNDCVDARESSNVTLSGVAISNPGQDVTGATQGFGGHGVYALNLKGSNGLSGGSVSGFNLPGRDGLLVTSNMFAQTFTVAGTTFQNGTGGSGVRGTAAGTANVTLNVGGATSNPATNSTFSNILSSAVIASSADTSTLNLTVQNSTFQNSPVEGKMNIEASTAQAGHGAFNVLNNTFNNVYRTASTGVGLVNLTGGGTVAGNTFSANVSGNTISNVGGGTTACGGGAAFCAGPTQAIVIFASGATNVSGTVVVNGNNLTAVQQGGLLLDLANTGAGLSPVSAKITNNVFGTNSARVGAGGASVTVHSGIRVIRRVDGSPSANVLVSGNTVRNGSGSAGSALNSPGIFLRTQNTASMDVTATGNDVETNTSGVVAEVRADTVNATSTLCLDANGNTLAAGSGLISLTEGTGVLNVEQASAAALATANGIPAGNISPVSGSPNYGVACAAPVAMLRPYTNAGRNYLASVQGSTKSGHGFAYLSGSRSAEPFETLPGLDAWRSNSKSLGGPWFGYAARSVALVSGLTDTVVRPARAAALPATAYAPAAPPAPFSGETVSVNVGTLPAGKSITITFQATINNPFNATQASNQGTVSGSNFAPVPTDDPSTGAFGDPTLTQVGVPATISCPADINVNTDAGQFSASVAFAVTAAGTPNPTVDCKVGATSITSPHTFPVGTTAVQCTATNGVGAPASCSFNVTVNDNQAPVVNCPPDVAASAAPNSCDASVNVGTPSVVDNDPSVTASGTRSDAQPLSATYPVGTTTITWTATDAAGNSGSCQQTVTVADATAPVITLNGPAATTVECHTSFADPGANASDNCGGSVPVTAAGSVNVNVPGNYAVTYNATDAAGNAAAPVTRTVTVVDTTQPTVSLNGAADVTVECHTSYADAGASANDSCAGALPVSVSGSVNANAVGDYTLTYTATDASGNTGTATRVVHVRDTTAPAVTLNGANPLTVTQGSAFVDPGATAVDSCGGPLPVNVSGSVNTAVVGTYTLTYTATDASGNTGAATRTVFVVYSFNGFFSPVNNPPVLNEVKAGQNVPLKFSLNGYKGMAIFAPGYPASQQVSCANNVPINVLEETDATGNSSLTYDAGSDRYHYNWKTEKSWAGTCRVLVVKLSDGTTHTANFKFK